MQVVDWMTREPETVFTHTPLASCARRMVKHGFRHLPVVGSQGELVGILTDFAVDQAGHFVGVAWKADDPDERAVAGDHSVPVDVVPRPDWPLVPVLRSLMRSWQEAAVVVDADRRPVGILTEQDVVRMAAERLPEGFLAVRRGRPVVSLEAGADAHAAFDLMVAHRVRHVVVLDGDRPFGIVSFRDVVGAGVTRGRELRADALSGDALKSISEGTPVVEAAALMAEHHIGCVPVVDFAGRAVAVLTASDLLALLVAVLEGTELPETWDAGHVFNA